MFVRAIATLTGAFAAALAGMTASWAAELVRVGESKPVLARPHDLILASDKSLLYVADQNNGVITVLDPKTLAVRGAFGKGELSIPHDVDWDRQGRLLVADTGNDRIAIYAVDGAQGRLAGEIKGGLGRTEGLAVGPGGRIYATSVADGTVVVFDKGKPVAKSGSTGSGPGQYSSPHDIVIAPDKTIWVADSANNRVKILDRTLKVIRILAGKPYNFDGVRYMDFDKQGRAYLADKYTNRVLVLGKDLKIQHVVAGLNRPEGVEIDGNRVYLSDTYNDKVVLYEWR